MSMTFCNVPCKDGGDHEPVADVPGLVFGTEDPRGALLCQECVKCGDWYYSRRATQDEIAAQEALSLEEWDRRCVRLKAMLAESPGGLSGRRREADLQLRKYENKRDRR